MGEASILSKHSLEEPQKGCHVKNLLVGSSHSSVDSLAPSILPPRVRVPSTSTMLYSIYIWIDSFGKDKTDMKRGRDWPIFVKKTCCRLITSFVLHFFLSLSLSLCYATKVNKLAVGGWCTKSDTWPILKSVRMELMLVMFLIYYRARTAEYWNGLRH